MKPIRWGILGPGKIAGKFAAGLAAAEGAELVAVASRSPERGAAFAAEWGAPVVHSRYEDLAADRRLDAVYVATPHAFHEEHATLCLRGGKHVLCEKSFALSAAQARRMAAAARENRVLLMEGMWTRFLPAIVRVHEVIAAGTIGDPRLLLTDFGFRATYDPRSRLFDPALGGGTLLDLGVYPVAMAFSLFGPPLTFETTATLAPTGVDEEAAVIMHHAAGRSAVFATSFTVDTPKDARILGAEGWIRIHAPWWAATTITVGKGNEDGKTTTYPHRGQGFAHVAEHFMDLIRSGKRESPVMPLDESVAVMATLDAIRARWGMRYPCE
ncbi:MAG: Gfo/Idh/MocA family oxidoreductase [bacterium]